MDTIQEISKIKEGYEKGTITILDGLTHSQPNIIQKVEFYTNSQYLNGMFDEFNRYKPFYNIVNFRVNVAVKATDLDTKDIQVYAENPRHAVHSMIFNKEVKNWMREENFAKTLNTIGFTRAKYGGVLVKKVMKNGRLCIEVPEWKNLITDQVDIKNGVKIEKHYLTPVQIQKKRQVLDKLDENWDDVMRLIEQLDDGMYTNSSRLCVLEVEGEFENEYINETPEEGYSLQRHIIVCDINEEPKILVHSEKLKESAYKYLPWLEASGRGLGIGIVEDGFNAQYATNDMILKQNDILELAAKAIVITDSSTIENNILSDTKTGDMIKVEKGDQTQVLNLMPASFPQLEQINKAWDEQYSRVSSSFEAVTGETMPSGTPFRSIAIQNQEAQSTFNYRREEMGIFLREIFTDWIIPFLAKRLSKQHILASDFEDDELAMIDEAFAAQTANQFVIDQLLAGKVTTQEEYNDMIAAQKQLLASTFKKRRFLDIPDNFFKDVEMKLDIITTGEQVNKTAVFETISNMIAVIASNPAVTQDPILKKLLAKAIELSGIGINIDALMAQVPTSVPNTPQNAPQGSTEALQAPSGMQPEPSIQA